MAHKQVVTTRPRLGTTISPGSLRDMPRSPFKIQGPFTARPIRVKTTVSEPPFVKAARRSGSAR